MDDGVAGGAAIQHRELQNYESKSFNSYFSKGIIYKDGGVSSGFNHVTPNDFSEIQRLLWVRGKNPVRCTQVPMSWDSLNLSDCFILDIGKLDNYSSLVHPYVQAMTSMSGVGQTQIPGRE